MSAYLSRKQKGSFIKHHRNEKHTCSSLLLAVTAVFAQTAAQPAYASEAYTVAERGPNHQVWVNATAEPDPTGSVRWRTNRYTEMKTGLGHLVQDQWLLSTPELRITSTGVEGTNTQHSLAILGNINSAGAVDLTMPNGQHLTSAILGLAFEEKSSGKSVMIATIKDSQGLLLPSGSEVLFPDCFDGLQADVLYVNQIGGLEQFVILRQQLPPASDWNLGGDCVLEAITEFAGSQPNMTPVQTELGPDQYLDFGPMQMGRGEAFALGVATNKIRVLKEWRLYEGNRRCLVEQVPLKQLVPQMQGLPPPPPRTASLRNSPDSPLDKITTGRTLPAREMVSKITPPIKVASAAQLGLGGQGLALDYSILTSQSNLTLTADSTFYVSGTVNATGTTTCEGNSVIKFTNDPNAQILFSGPFVCKTAPGRMAIFCSKNDDSVGDQVDGSTGSPTNANGATYLSSSVPGYPGYTNVFQHLRFSNAGTALALQDASNNDLWHCQFVKCGLAINWCDDCSGQLVGVHNALFARCGTVTSFRLNGEHLTVDGGALSTGSEACHLTNSILTAVTNVDSTYFVNCAIGASSAGFYQSVGAGNYYLANGSTNRNTGTTNITPGLLANLVKRTTHPPLLYSNVVLAANTVLFPQAARDSGPLLDRGFHYQPIDYLTCVLMVTNATLAATNVTLTIPPGTVVASYNDMGIWLQRGSAVTAVGKPLNPIVFTRYSAIQEQPLALGGSGAWPGAGIAFNTYPFDGSTGQTGAFRFVDFTCPAGGGNHLYDSGSWSFRSLLVQDCEFWSGENNFSCTSNTTATIKNNLFSRSRIAMTFADSDSSTLCFSNNLVYASPGIAFQQGANMTWNAFDNMFDSCTFGLAHTVTNGYNAYVNCNRRLDPTNTSDLILTNSPAYQSGPLGDFYLPTNSSLCNTGSVAANVAGFYYWTTATNQVAETNSTLDIGLHYPALDGSGNPLDPDVLGLPDSYPVNVSRAHGIQFEPAVAVNPADPSNVFLVANNPDTIFTAVSHDAGVTWTTGSLTNVLRDPSAAFDRFGNLFLACLESISPSNVVVLLSTNGGASFNTTPVFRSTIIGDQPTVVTGSGGDIAPVSAWVTYTDFYGGGRVYAAGTGVTNLGGIRPWTNSVWISGSDWCDYGDIAIGPAGQVALTFQYLFDSGNGPTPIYVSVDPDGLGTTYNFGATNLAWISGAGTYERIPAQANRAIDVEPGLAWDCTSGPHSNRLYLVYTERTNQLSAYDTDIYLIYSDDNGGTWSTNARTKINDDLTSASQFNPRIAVDQTSGSVAVSWHDCRNDPTNNVRTKFYAAVSHDGGVSFGRNFKLEPRDSDTAWTTPPSDWDYGDYSGLAFYGGFLFPAWADNSNSTGDNPDYSGPSPSYDMDVYVARFPDQ
jgi:hypothetical protein